jgi:two-component system LytT family response regulator/two-component system response regulator LytT
MQNRAPAPVSTSKRAQPSERVNSTGKRNAAPASPGVREDAATSSALSAILADDEPLAREELAYQLRDFPDIEVIATAANGLEALKLIEDLEPDLVFMDVQMPGLDGLGVIRKLRESDAPMPYFVMATAHDQYAVEAFRWEALDYLLKPVEKDRLALALERARKGIAERAKTIPEPPPIKPALQRTKLLVKSNHRNFIVDAQEVVYATIADGLITVVAANLEGQSNYRTIEELQSNLDPDMFWRVHRSYLVNIHRIKEVIPWFKSSFQLRMDDKKQTEIPVSRVQTKRLRALLKL